MWTSDENKLLLQLHSTYMSKWKLISSFFSGRTGGQVKNQFFNIIRTLLRKALKISFRRYESFVVSEIKPKVLSEIVNKQIGHFIRNAGQWTTVSVKNFLLEFVSQKWIDSTIFTQAKNVLQSIKIHMIETKFINEQRLFDWKKKHFF